VKYLVTWRLRAGASAADNEAGAKRVLDVYARWSPPDEVTFHQFLFRVDGCGGHAVIEADDPLVVLRTTANFTPYLDYEVIPVVDIEPAVAVLVEAAEFRASVT
jgi:hypothetical protein